MIVLHVDTGTEEGGGQRQLVALVRCLAECGVQSAVAAPPGSPVLEELRDVATVHPTALHGSVDPAGSLRVWRAVRRVRADVLHANSAHAHTLCIPVSMASGVPLVVTRRNLSTPQRWSIGRAARYRAADRIVCVSEAVRADLESLGAPPERLRIARSALTRMGRPGDAEVVACRARYAQGASPVLASLGMLERVKGHDLLVDAVAALAARWPRLVAVLAGAGREEGALRARAAARGVGGRIVFAGYLADPLPLLAACDVYVHPSRSEGASGAILEALAQDRPVVAAAVGGVLDVMTLEDGSLAGELVPPEDAVALAEAVDRVLADPPAARARAERGAVHARSAFSVEAMTAATLAAYEECVRAS